MGVTWDIDLRLFFDEGCVLADRSPPSSRVLPFQPLLAAAFISSKGAESPGSGRIRVIGALVFFPSEAVLDKLRSPWPPSSTIRHRDVVEYSEVADSVHVGT